MELKSIDVLGLGYVGLTTCALLRARGLPVHGIDNDKVRLDMLSAGLPAFSEPTLNTFISQIPTDKLMTLSTRPNSATCLNHTLIVALPAPTSPNGTLDTSNIERSLATLLARDQYDLVILRSTLLPGTTIRLQAEYPKTGFAYWPEFMNQGKALPESVKPDRVVLGTDSETARWSVSNLVDMVYPSSHNVLWLTTKEAEATKYFSNALLAANKILSADFALHCAAIGLDTNRVLHAVSADHRLSSELLRPRPSLVDSCLAKDVRALAATMSYTGTDNLIAAVMDSSDSQRAAVNDEISLHLSGNTNRAKILVVGAGFEPRVGDIGEALSVTIAEAFKNSADVVVFDPYVEPSGSVPFTLVPILADAIEWCEVLIVAVELPEIHAIDFNEWVHSVTDVSRVIFNYCASDELDNRWSKLENYHSWGAPGKCQRCAV